LPLYLGKSKKVIFQEYYSYIRQIIYITSEKKQTFTLLPPHLKNDTALPCKMQNFFDLTEGNVAFLQTLVALRRTGCDVWQLEC